MADHDELLVMRPAEPDPLIEQHLAAGLFDPFAEVLVLLLAVGKLVQMRPPHQPLDDHAAFRRCAEHLGNRRAAVAHLLVRVAAPVREEQVVPRLQGFDFGGQMIEVGRPVDQRLHAIAAAPSRHARVRVTALLVREEPARQIGHATAYPLRREPTLCQDRACLSADACLRCSAPSH